VRRLRPRGAFSIGVENILQINFVLILLHPIFNPQNKDMKKTILSFAMLIALASCSKRVEPPPVEPENKFFSQVMRYKDQRQPGVDTVWTLHLEGPDMLATFSALDGYVYDETSTYQKVGVLYSK
jgi:hypothetical protein